MAFNLYVEYCRAALKMVVADIDGFAAALASRIETDAALQALEGAPADLLWALAVRVKFMTDPGRTRLHLHAALRREAARRDAGHA